MNLETLYLRFVFDGKDVNRGLRDLKKSLKDIQNIGSRQLVRTFAKLASVVGFTKMTLDASSFARSMTYLAQKTGVASSKLSNMKTAFDKVNGSGDQAVKLIERIGKGVAGARFGDYKTISQLSKMGIGYKGRSSESIMFSMADWANRQIASGTLSMAQLSALFEKEFGIGQELTKLMAGGSKELRRYIQESGAALGEETEEGIEKRNKLANAINGLNASFERLKNQIITELAPALTKIVDVFADLIGWCSRHSEVSAIATALIALFSSLSALKWVLGIGTALKALAVGASGAAGAIASVTGALSTAVGVLLPLVSVGAAGYAGIKLWNQEKVTDASYWNRMQREAYIGFRENGMSQDDAHREATKFINAQRRKFGVKEERLTEFTSGSLGADAKYGYTPLPKDGNYIIGEDGKPIPIVMESSANPIINDIDINTEVRENPDGTYTTTTNVNGESFSGGNTSQINIAQVSTDGGAQ